MSDPHLKVLSDHLDSLLIGMMEKKAVENEMALNGMAVVIKTLMLSLEHVKGTAEHFGDVIIKLLNMESSTGERLDFDFADISESHTRDLIAGIARLVQHAHAITDPIMEIVKPDSSIYGIDLDIDKIKPPKEDKSRKSPYVPDGNKYP